MALPSPHHFQAARCLGVARRKRGYQSRGVLITRPSVSVTISKSSVISTAFPTGSLFSGEVFVPRGFDFIFMFYYQFFDLVQLMARKPAAISERDGADPELAPFTVTGDVHVRRLFAFVRVECEFVRSWDPDRWHGTVYQAPAAGEVGMAPVAFPLSARL